MENLKNIKDKNSFYLFAIFIFFLVWRLVLYFIPATPYEDFNVLSFAWGASYQLIALFGAISGLIIAQSWGGWKSILGRAIFAFAVGLLFQSLGQIISSYYILTTSEIPYPSFGDIGFFGSIGFYIYGTFMLAKLAGVKVSIQNFSKKIQALLIPLIALIISYFIFLEGHEIDWSNPVQLLLDFGYPLGQAFYVSIAFLVFLLSRNVLGGVMKWPVLLFLIALGAQYFSDFTFLYQVTRGLYIPEGVNDLMYFFSYFLMALSLIRLGATFDKIRNS